MSLVQQLDISLKDFVPSEPGLVIKDKGGTAAYVSHQLYGRINNFAVQNRVSTASVIRRLRDELNAKPPV